jgi:AcrR family transcriptional regulator
MKQKKLELIEAAIKLFAEKGFQSTSVQDIVTEYGISKGAFYNYFSSKEELLLAIFDHYYAILRTKILEISEADLAPREKMKKQIKAQFEFFIQHRDFIVMHIREQNHSINKELRKYLQKNIIETIKWYESHLIMIYGEEIRPFIGDVILSLDGIRNSYLRVTIFERIQVNLDTLSEFIMKRIDELVVSFLEKGEQPVIGSYGIDSFFRTSWEAKSRPEEEVVDILNRMKAALERLPLKPEKQEELMEAADFLVKEATNIPIKKYIFQGLLTNFKGIEELEEQRQQIGNLLGIKLL